MTSMTNARLMHTAGGKALATAVAEWLNHINGASCNFTEPVKVLPEGRAYNVFGALTYSEDLARIRCEVSAFMAGWLAAMDLAREATK